MTRHAACPACAWQDGCAVGPVQNGACGCAGIYTHFMAFEKLVQAGNGEWHYDMQKGTDNFHVIR